METEVTVSSTTTAASSSTPPAQAKLVAKQRDNRKTTSSTPSFLSNLGRATLRGIRKCPQCGVYNGTRGLSCKNKACGVSLRNPSAGGRNGKKCAVEVVKVIIDSEERGKKEREGDLGGGSGGGVQVFSVCHRGRGATATQLGFVELVPTDTAIATGDGETLLTRINLGRCFMPSCRQGQRSNHSEAGSAATGSQQSDSLCVHIKQAIECQSCATPLTLKSSVLDGLPASVQAKKELWRLATESPGPLVQLVSKDTLVVKCHTDSRHPLGLLHLTVGAGGLSEVSKTERKGREAQQLSVFHCACQSSSNSSRRNKPGVDAAAGATNCQTPPSSATPPPCLHFYACVCAFASNDKLAVEFAAFINYTSSQQQSATSRTTNSSEKPLQQVEPNNSQLKAKKLRLDEASSSSAASPSGVGKEGMSASDLRKAGQRKSPGGGGLKALGCSQAVDEQAVTLGFQHWLASVTERIHQTMQYQCDGKPQPLVYHIPQEFFNALQQRLSLGSKKRRLPNFTTVVLVKNDGYPLGPLSKYTWHITNLMQVKRIFDTPELPLELSQSFVKNADGSYSRFRCPDPPPELDVSEGCRTDRPLAIRPMELCTFLKVGPGAVEQKGCSPFVIEWIPDVLPRCHIGELRISFEFGHQQSGQSENSEKTTVLEKGGRYKSDLTQPKPTKTIEIIQVVI